MGKTKKWGDIKNAAMSRDRQAKARAAADEALATLPLAELRKARDFTQAQLAEELDVPQGGVSKLERRVDMYVSTLRRYIEAMGGELNIIAHFPDADVRVEFFEDLGSLSRAPARSLDHKELAAR